MDVMLRNIILQSLEGSIGILLIVILKKITINRYTKTFDYYIWLIIILKLLIPFKFPITLYSNFFNSSKVISTYQSVLIYADNINYPLCKTLFLSWSIVVVALTFYHIYNYFNFARKIRFLAYDIADDDIINLYLKLLHELNIKKNISLKYCSGISSPLGIGIFKPLILLPADIYNIKELEWILKHELIHFKKHDLYYKIIIMVTVTVHWFNPLVYIMGKMISYDCERACDEILLKNSDIKSRKSYAMILIKSLRSNKRDTLNTKIITGFNNDHITLKFRIENILNTKMRKKGIIIGILIIAVTLISFLSIRIFAESSNTISKPSVTTTNTIKADTKGLKSPDTSKILYKGMAKNIPEEFIHDTKQVQYIKDHPSDEVVIIGR